MVLKAQPWFIRRLDCVPQNEILSFACNGSTQSMTALEVLLATSTDSIQIQLRWLLFGSCALAMQSSCVLKSMEGHWYKGRQASVTVNKLWYSGDIDFGPETSTN